MVNVVIGSPKLLVFKDIDQAIVDFDLQKDTFNFIDKEDLKVKRDVLLDYMVASGFMFNKCFYENHDTKQYLNGSKLPELINSKEKELFSNLRTILAGASPVITKDRKCVLASGDNF